MNFTEFLARRPKNIPTPSFISLARLDPHWPAESNRLQDFEVFLVGELQDESPPAIAELRRVWLEFARAEPNGKHDLDSAIAAWADYVHHLKWCKGDASEKCYLAEGLYTSALLASQLDDLDGRGRKDLRCELEGDSRDAEEDEPLDDEDEGEWTEAPLDDGDGLPTELG